MVHKGYTEPPLQTVNGVVINLVHFNFSGVSEEQQMKFHHDFGACFDRNVMYVESAYRDDVANPELYRDLDVAMVDCLRRHELVPVEYTVAQYRRESDAFTNMTFDGEQLIEQQVGIIGHHTRTHLRVIEIKTELPTAQRIRFPLRPGIGHISIHKLISLRLILTNRITLGNQIMTPQTIHQSNIRIPIHFRIGHVYSVDIVHCEHVC